MMRSLSQTLLVLGLCASCVTGRHSAKNPLWTVQSSNVCVAGGGQFKIKVVENEYLRIPSGYAAPKVELRRGTLIVPTSATFDVATSMLTITVDRALELGTYEVLVTAPNQPTDVLKDTLKVDDVPKVTGVQSGQLCSTQTEPYVVKIQGENLSPNSAVTLSGSTTVLPVTFKSAQEIEVTVPKELVQTGQTYTLHVNNGPAGCDAEAADSVNVLDPPSISGVKIGPNLRDGQSVPSNAKVTVRVTGDHLVAGLLVDVDSNTPVTAISSGGSSIDAIFAAGVISAGAHSIITVKTGMCQASATKSFSVVNPTSIVNRVSPSAITSGQTKNFVDIFGELGTSPTLQIDVNADPIEADWVALPPFAKLGAKNNGQRFVTTGLSALSAGPHDLRMISGNNEAFIQAGVTVLPTSTGAPRIVYKERDAIGSAGGTVTVYGCNLSANFSLIDENAHEVVKLAAVVSTGASLDAWGKRFRCLNDGTNAGLVTAQAKVTIPPASAALPAGVYRLRMTSTVDGVDITADDLYPFVIETDAPNIKGYDGTGSNFQLLSDVQLKVGRKNPSVVVASDAVGMKYLYVIGGDKDASPSLNPVIVGAAEPSYEYSPVDFEHHLMGFIESTETDKTWPLTGSDSSATTAVGKAYGASVVADGTQLYWMGGTADGIAATNLILQFSVIDPTKITTMPMGQLSTATNTGFVIGNNLFGTRAEIIPVDSMIHGSDGAQVVKKIVVMGGVTGNSTIELRAPSKLIGVIPLTADGAAKDPEGFNNLELTTPQAFMSSVKVQNNLLALGGFKDVTNTGSKILVTPSLKSALLNYSSQLQIDDQAPHEDSQAALNFFGSNAFTSGQRAFLLGGATNDPTPNPVVGNVQIRNTIMMGNFNSTTRGPFSNIKSTLARKRTGMGTVVLPPMIYVVSGVICSSNATGEIPGCYDADISGILELSNHIEAARLDP